MAVHKSRKTRSRRNMRRMHQKLVKPTLSVDKESGEVHKRHHMTKKGYYRGRQVIVIKEKDDEEESQE